MEISTVAAEEDTTAATIAINSTHCSDADETESQNEEIASNQAKEVKRVDKGKSKDQKKHGVMSLPAEIRETYAFQSRRLEDRISLH